MDKTFFKKTQQDALELSVAGAMARHRNPFEEIEVPRNKTNLPKEFVNKWVVPFYMAIHSGNIDLSSFGAIVNEITSSVIAQLLGDFNWRTRICGAFFAAIKKFDQFEDIIGNHLLKSEVCYAGTGYCLALSQFGTAASKDYLTRYLEYYLDQADLWFDQADAYCALEYIDTNAAKVFHKKWGEFIIDKPNLSLDISRKNFTAKIEIIREIRNLSLD